MNVLFMGDIILIVLALAALIVASYTDFKKREVANWVSFSLVIVAIILRTIVSILLYTNFLSIVLSVGMLLVFLLGFFFLLRNQKPWLEYIVAIIFMIIWFFTSSFHLDYIRPVFLIFGIFIIA